MSPTSTQVIALGGVRDAHNCSLGIGQFYLHAQSMSRGGNEPAPLSRAGFPRSSLRIVLVMAWTCIKSALRPVVAPSLPTGRGGLNAEGQRRSSRLRHGNTARCKGSGNAPA